MADIEHNVHTRNIAKCRAADPIRTLNFIKCLLLNQFSDRQQLKVLESNTFFNLYIIQQIENLLLQLICWAKLKHGSIVIPRINTVVITRN